MNINILWIIVVAFLIVGAVTGFKRGLVEETMRLVTSILGIVVLVILAKGIGNFIQGSYMNVLMALILLVLVRIFHRIGKLILDSCKLVSKLPVIHSMDKVAGLLLGMLEILVFVWLVFIVVGVTDTLELQSWFMTQVKGSMLLSILYETNVLVLLLQNF